MLTFAFSDQEIKKYEEFLDEVNVSSINQSSAFLDLYRGLNHKTFKLGLLDDNEELIAVMLLIKFPLYKKYSYLNVPCGPVFDPHKHSWKMIFSSFLPYLKKIAEVENAVFLRVSPRVEEKKLLKIPGLRISHIQNQPQSTLQIDLTKSEGEILAEMKQKGRYNIKVAQKHGVKVRFSNGENGDIEKFYKILAATADRDGFRVHPFIHYQKFLSVLNSRKLSELAIAEEGKEILCAAIVTYFKDRATYYYGASSDKNRNFMAPYLLQWEMIKRAKEKGFKTYDFLGISPQGKGGHAWQKVTDFKLKFGGQIKNYAAEREYPFRPFLYYLLLCFKKIRSYFR